MKIFIILTLLFGNALSYGQNLDVRLKTAITKIETENYIERETDYRNKYKDQLEKAGDTTSEIRVISVQVDIFKYSIISLKSWWKNLFDIHNSWATNVHDITLALTEQDQKLDSVARQKFEEEFKTGLQEQEKKDTTSFNYKRYFKEKYEKTDSSIKVYEVFYKVDLRATNNGMYQTDTIRMALYQNTLAEVKSF
jgi:hypothetical protein